MTTDPDLAPIPDAEGQTTMFSTMDLVCHCCGKEPTTAMACCSDCRLPFCEDCSYDVDETLCLICAEQHEESLE